jgi:hypothetical protein
MSPRLRKLFVTTHVIASVGWIGAVAAFLALAVIGLTNDDGATVRGAYLVMAPAGRWLLVPLAIASLVTGAVLSLGTSWGLFRHYWVIFKLAINVFATVVLVEYLGTFRLLATVAADAGVAVSDLRNPSPAVHAVLAMTLLVVATVLGVYRPRGLTERGWRKQHEAHTRFALDSPTVGLRTAVCLNRGTDSLTRASGQRGDRTRAPARRHVEMLLAAICVGRCEAARCRGDPRIARSLPHPADAA